MVAIDSSCACVVVSVLRCHSCGGYHIANIYEPPTEHWNNTNLPPVLSHPAVLVGDFNSHRRDWGYQEADLNGESLQEWALIFMFYAYEKKKIDSSTAMSVTAAS